MYVIYYFDDYAKGERYHCESKAEADILRFLIYKTYDGDRISKNGFIVPVSEVKKMLVPMEEISKYTLISPYSKKKSDELLK